MKASRRSGVMWQMISDDSITVSIGAMCQYFKTRVEIHINDKYNILDMVTAIFVRWQERYSTGLPKGRHF